MVYAQFKIIGSAFVYISNILNSTGNKLKSNIHVINFGKTEGGKKLAIVTKTPKR